MSRGQQLRQGLLVAGGVADLGDRPLVPIQAQPGQSVEDLVDVGLSRSLAVGIFDPQHERARAAALTVRRGSVRKQPVIERRTGPPDVERAGR